MRHENEGFDVDRDTSNPQCSRRAHYLCFENTATYCNKVIPFEVYVLRVSLVSPKKAAVIGWHTSSNYCEVLQGNLNPYFDSPNSPRVKTTLSNLSGLEKSFYATTISVLQTHCCYTLFLLDVFRVDKFRWNTWSFKTTHSEIQIPWARPLCK